MAPAATKTCHNLIYETMPKSILIIPDSREVVDADTSWYHGYKNTLRSKDNEAFVARSPDEIAGTADEWMEDSAALLGYYTDSNGVLVGQGLGGITVLRALERREGEEPIAGAMLVSTPIGVPSIHDEEKIKTFSGGFEFDWAKIRASAETFRVFHACDDPLVAVENGLSIVSHLGAQALGIFPGGGRHFTTPDGEATLLNLLPNLR